VESDALIPLVFSVNSSLGFSTNKTRITNARNLAKAITSNRGAGDLILDTKKVPVEKVEGWDAPEEPAAAVAGEADGPAAEGTGEEVAEEDKAEDRGTSH